MKKVKNSKKKYLSPFTVLASAVCVVLAAFVLNGYISLNELAITNSKMEKELQSLCDQNTVLQLEIERKNSLANIEEIATEQLNMVKLQSYQIHAVNLASDDSVEITAPSNDSGLFDGIVASFNILLEYLN
jgi:cell division protein FtsB